MSRYIVLPARAPSIFALQIHTCKRTTMRSLQILCNAINHCKYHSPSNTPHQSNTHSSVNPRINKYYCVPKCHQQIITGTAALLLLELYRACSPIRSIPQNTRKYTQQSTLRHWQTLSSQSPAIICTITMPLWFDGYVRARQSLSVHPHCQVWQRIGWWC